MDGLCSPLVLFGFHNFTFSYEHFCDAGCIYLSNHAVPLSVDVLAVPPVGHQVKVVGETDDFCQTLQDVDAEPFAAVLQGATSLHHQTETTTRERIKFDAPHYPVRLIRRTMLKNDY